MVLRLEAKRQKIFQQFLYSERLRFSELHRQTKIPSNLLAYFLKKMVSEGALERRGNMYKLSEQSERIIPFFVKSAEMISPLVVVLAACVSADGKKVLLIRRDKRPYKGFWSLLSGRLLISESIADAAPRVMREKAFCETAAPETKSVIYERLLEKGGPKHGFVFFLVKVVAEERGVKEKEFLKWFDIAALKKREVIASDYWMVKEHLGLSAKVFEETIGEGRKTTKMRLLQ